MNGAKLLLSLNDFMRVREQLNLLRFLISWTQWRLLEMRYQMTAFCTDTRLDNGGKNCSSLCNSFIVIEFFKIAICVVFISNEE